VAALDLFNLSGDVAVVTGGAGGIGFAITEGLASAGAATVIADVLGDQGRDAAARLRARGLRAVFVPLDVRKRVSVQEMVAETLREYGQIDILVNSAGVILRKPIEEVTDEEWDALMEVNLRGIFVCCQVVGKEMIRRQRGKVINVSSNICQVLQPHRGVYAVSKAGLSQLTRVLALEWAPHRINVNAIAPAPTLTDLNRQYFEDHPEDLRERIASIPLGRMGDPQDYVGAAVFLASRASDFLTGQTLFVDGGSNLK
jgi:NAD(P)-dependent dehydrogenase (short-subunit alcohol dehydrogenase family)